MQLAGAVSKSFPFVLCSAASLLTEEIRFMEESSLLHSYEPDCFSTEKIAWVAYEGLEFSIGEQRSLVASPKIREIFIDHSCTIAVFRGSKPFSCDAVAFALYEGIFRGNDVRCDVTVRKNRVAPPGSQVGKIIH